MSLVLNFLIECEKDNKAKLDGEAAVGIAL